MMTLEDFAWNVAHREGTILDEKQYMVYLVLVYLFF